MFEIIKNVIKNKDFELKDILYKINKMWIESAITEEQKNELDALARENANIDNSIDILQKLKELDERVLKLENKTEEKPEEPTEPVIEYPAYVPGKWYYRGDNCSENGKNYTCTAPEGQVCTWSPSEYPPYWEEVTAEDTAKDNTESEVEE